MWNHFDLRVRGDGSVSVCLCRPASLHPDAGSIVSFARDERSGSLAVVHGRFYYKDDHVRRWPRSLETTAVRNEAAFGLSAFLAGGEAAIDALEGDYSLAIWDARRGRLLATRDPFGGGPLYWWSEPGEAGVGTDLKRLRRDTEIDETYLADCLTRTFGSGEVPSERTPCRGVRRLRPSHRLELAPDRPARVLRSWRWEDHLVPDRDDDAADAVERFAELLRSAVEERVAGRRAAAHLSGGLDSTTVAALANGASGHRRGTLLATLSLVYTRGEQAGERSFVDDSIAHIAPPHAELLPADDVLDYDPEVALAIDHGEPRGGLRGLATQLLLTRSAERLGADLMLTGVGCDELLATPVFSLADAVRQGHWLRAFGQAKGLARSRNQGLGNTLHDHALAILWPVVAREGMRAVLRRGRGRWPDLGSFAIPPWVDPAFASRHRLFDRTSDRIRPIPGRPAIETHCRNVFAAGAGDWNRSHLGEPHGVSTAHPFRDPRLVMSTLGLPEAIRVLNPPPKRLLREATTGLLPESVRRRVGKCGFDEVNGRALNRNATAIADWIRRSSLASAGLIDAATLTRCLAQAAVGIGDVVATDRIGQTLALITWSEQWGRCGHDVATERHEFPATGPRCEVA